MLNLEWIRSQHGTVYDSGCNCSMDRMVDFVSFEAEHFAKSSSGLVNEDHALECILTVVLFIVVTGSHYNWVKVIVAELTSIMAFNVGIVSKNGSI